MYPFGFGRIWADIVRSIGSWAHLCQQVSCEVLWQRCFPSACPLASVPRYSYQQDVVLCRCWPVSNCMMLYYKFTSWLPMPAMAGNVIWYRLSSVLWLMKFSIYCHIPMHTVPSTHLVSSGSTGQSTLLRFNSHTCFMFSKSIAV